MVKILGKYSLIGGILPALLFFLFFVVPVPYVQSIVTIATWPVEQLGLSEEGLHHLNTAVFGGAPNTSPIVILVSVMFWFIVDLLVYAGYRFLRNILGVKTPNNSLNRRL